jgi:phage tail tape-measure protein
MKQKKITVEMMDKAMSSETIQKLVDSTALSIENKVKSGMKLSQAKKETFEELETIMQAVKKLALAKYNSRVILKEDQDKLF